MPDPFFAQPASGKRKRARPAKEQRGRKPGKPTRGGKAAGSGSRGKGKRKARDEDSEEEDSESDEVGDGGFDSDVDIPSAGEEVYSDDYESERETPAQKRLRLAKAYLDKLNEAERGMCTAQASSPISLTAVQERMASSTLLKSTASSSRLDCSRTSYVHLHALNARCT